jgi:hypothetical protein
MHACRIFNTLGLTRHIIVLTVSSAVVGGRASAGLYPSQGQDSTRRHGQAPARPYSPSARLSEVTGHGWHCHTVGGSDGEAARRAGRGGEWEKGAVRGG